MIRDSLANLARLSDGISAEDRRPLVPGLAPLTLVDAGGRSAESTSAAAGGSFLNVFEARLIADLVSGLLGAGTPSLTAASIGVICLCACVFPLVVRVPSN